MTTEEEVVYNEDFLHCLLPLYYGRIFPKELYHQWLCYGDPAKFPKRELSFTLLGDIYIRYLSYQTLEEFADALVKKTPVKIDIGAVYKKAPQAKFRSQHEDSIAIEKELVFDIDMTDYDPIRTCCSGADVCQKCWKFMAIACKILDAALREDFGFKNILWVFSGRRGIHCWVADATARHFKDRARITVVEYLQVFKSGNNKRKLKVSGNELHPALDRALAIIEEYFLKYIVPEQDILGTPERLKEFLSFIEKERDEFAKAMQAVEGSVERWHAFENTFTRLSRESRIPKNMNFLVEELKLFYTYPRLDINVTKSINHLLKAPFCVHPKTGKVSVPFNPKNIDNFDISSVPTISMLVHEINQYDEKSKQQQMEIVDKEADNGSNLVRIKDYKKTSLLKHVNIFNEFLRGVKQATEAQKENKLDF